MVPKHFLETKENKPLHLTEEGKRKIKKKKEREKRKEKREFAI